MHTRADGRVTAQRVLHLFICGAGPAKRTRGDGWDVYCVATESAVQHFLDVESVADAVIVAPAIYSTINKWAVGVADNCVLTQLTGLGVRIVALPFVNQALAANRVFTRSVEELRAADVRVLFGPGELEARPLRTGDEAMTSFPWKLALRAARD